MFTLLKKGQKGGFGEVPYIPPPRTPPNIKTKRRACKNAIKTRCAPQRASGCGEEVGKIKKWSKI